MKSLKYIIYLVISFLSVTSLIVKEEFAEQEIVRLGPTFATDITEAPDNDVIQNLRRSCFSKQELFFKIKNESPTSSGLIISLLHSKEISEYFLLLFYKINEEINFLNLFKLY